MLLERGRERTPGRVHIRARVPRPAPYPEARVGDRRDGGSRGRGLRLSKVITSPDLWPVAFPPPRLPQRKRTWSWTRSGRSMLGWWCHFATYLVSKKKRICGMLQDDSQAIASWRSASTPLMYGTRRLVMYHGQGVAIGRLPAEHCFGTCIRRFSQSQDVTHLQHAQAEGKRHAGRRQEHSGSAGASLPRSARPAGRLETACSAVTVSATDCLGTVKEEAHRLPHPVCRKRTWSGATFSNPGNLWPTSCQSWRSGVLAQREGTTYRS